MTQDEINYFLDSLPYNGMDKIKKIRGQWVMYDNGDVAYEPETRDYWISADRLKTVTDLDQWINHLRRKTWWNDLLEVELEEITIESFRLRGILTKDIRKEIMTGSYLKN